MEIKQYAPSSKKPGINYQNTLNQLYKLLIRELANSCDSQNIEELIFSPFGQLNLINFATLLNDKNEFLCEDYNIKHIGSGRDLLREEVKVPKNKTLSVYFSPQFTDSDFRNDSANIQSTVQLNDVDKGRLRDGISFSPNPVTVAEASYLKENARKWNLDINSFTGSRATELSVHYFNLHIYYILPHMVFPPKYD